MKDERWKMLDKRKERELVSIVVIYSLFSPVYLDWDYFGFVLYFNFYEVYTIG